MILRGVREQVTHHTIGTGTRALHDTVIAVDQPNLVVTHFPGELVSDLNRIARPKRHDPRIGGSEESGGTNGEARCSHAIEYAEGV
jgi:hypothetical protein